MIQNDTKNELFSEEFLKMKKTKPYTNSQHKLAEVILEHIKSNVGDFTTVLEDCLTYNKTT